MKLRGSFAACEAAISSITTNVECRACSSRACQPTPKYQLEGIHMRLGNNAGAEMADLCRCPARIM